MVMSNWLMEIQIAMAQKEEWSYASMEYGVLCVMTSGEMKKQLLCVTTLDLGAVS